MTYPHMDIFFCSILYQKRYLYADIFAGSYKNQRGSCSHDAVGEFCFANLA